MSVRSVRSNHKDVGTCILCVIVFPFHFLVFYFYCIVLNNQSATYGSLMKIGPSPQRVKAQTCCGK